MQWSSQQSNFGTVRELMQRAPSSAAWAMLCEVIEHWDDFSGFEERVLPYLHDHLERWPDRLRQAPARWVARFLDGDAPLGLQLVRALTLTHDLDDAMWMRLTTHPKLMELRAVTLRETPLHGEHAALLSRSPFFAQLKHLQVCDTPLSEESLRALLGERAVGGLEHVALEELSLQNNALDATSAMLLASAPRARQVKRLDLSDNTLGDHGFKKLICHNGTSWEGLEALNVSANALRADGLKALGQSAISGQLVELNVYANALGALGVGVLSAMELPHLERLALGLNRLDGACIDALREGALLSNPERSPLRALNLDFTAQLSPEGLGALLALPALTGLRELSLMGCNLTTAHLSAMVAAPLTELTELNLNLNQLDAASLYVLAGASLPRLRRLTLSDNKLGARSLLAARNATWLPQLELLDLSRTGIGDSELRALHADPRFGAIQFLLLDGNPVNADGARALACSPTPERHGRSLTP